MEALFDLPINSSKSRFEMLPIDADIIHELERARSEGEDVSEIYNELERFADLFDQELEFTD